MITCVRTDSSSEHFIELVRQLDAYLAEINGERNAFFTQFNGIEQLAHVVVAYEHGMPVGCGAMKEYVADAMELKRMFVLPYRRGKGIAKAILSELEVWAAELWYKRCVLETSDKLKEAVGLYGKSGYNAIDNYGQYEGVEGSVCFEKVLR